MGQYGMFESVGLAEEKSVKTAHPPGFVIRACSERFLVQVRRISPEVKRREELVV